MAAAKTILVIEDDGNTRRALAAALESAGHRVVQSDGVEVGYHLFQTEKPDLIVLDITLPDGNGVDLCRKVRAHKALASTPVIMLTGKGQLDDKTAGFEAGADQYLVKPVLPQELLLWTQALLNRLALDKDEGGKLEAGDIVIDPDAHLVTFGETRIPNLTGKEFDLFYALVKKRPKVLSREWILSTLWRTVAVDNLVDAHMSKLRRKLPQALADRLQAVPGKGFRYFS
ncbi:MAG: response regulator transcription factor [Elusimicrobia bacterium]|nr:response regulator transcription factor [Elusimicrobiota bacterium]